MVLCAAYYVTLNAAPVLPSGYESEAVERQHLGEMRDGSIQANSILGQTFINVVSSLLSAASKTADPNDESQQILFDGFNTILSSIGKRVGNEGEIQSDGEMMKTLFGTLLRLTKSIDNGEVHVLSDSDKKALGRTLFNVAHVFFSAIRKESDPKAEVPQTILDGIGSFLSVIGKRLDEGQQSVSDNDIRRAVLDAIDNVFSAMRRDADPSDEMVQTFVNGFKTLFSAVRNKIENGGVIQSSDGEIKQAIMKFLGDSGEIQSLSDDDEFGRTIINVMKALVSAASRNTNPNNEFAKAIFNGIDAFFPVIAKVIGNGGSEPTDEDITNALVSPINSIIPAFMKWIESGKIQSTDRTDEAKTQLWGGHTRQLGYRSAEQIP